MTALEILKRAVDLMDEAHAAIIVEESNIWLLVQNRWVGILDGDVVDEADDVVSDASIDAVIGLAIDEDYEVLLAAPSVAGLVPVAGSAGSFGYRPQSLPAGARRLTDTGTGASIAVTADGLTVHDSADTVPEPENVAS